MVVRPLGHFLASVWSDFEAGLGEISPPDSISSLSLSIHAVELGIDIEHYCIIALSQAISQRVKGVFLREQKLIFRRFTSGTLVIILKTFAIIRLGSVPHSISFYLP